MKKMLCIPLLLAMLSCYATQMPTPFTLNSLFTPSNATAASYTFSGSTIDTVNYLQFCNFGTSNCSGICTGQYLTLNTGTPLNYSTNYNFSTQFFTNYFHAYGLTGGTYYVGMYAQSTHWNCPSNSKYCSTSSDNASQPLCIQVNYNGSTVTTVTQIDNGNALLNQSTVQYAYVADDQNSGVYQCSLANDGTFASCPTPTIPSGVTSWQPVGITFATFNGTQYAYVADSGGAVYQCTINGTGALSSCVATPNSAPSWNPGFIAFASIDGTQYGYVVDRGNHDTYLCTLNNNDGAFDNCNTTLDGSIIAANSLAFTTVINNGIATQYAYIAAQNNGVQRCALNTDGSLIDCSATPASGAPSWTPGAIAIATVSSIKYAYVADGNTSSIYKCTINNSGALSSCAATPTSGAPWSGTDDVWLATIDGAQYAYVADKTNSTVYHCPVNASDGTLNGNNCTATPASAPAWSPAGITTTYIPGG